MSLRGRHGEKGSGVNCMIVIHVVVLDYYQEINRRHTAIPIKDARQTQCKEHDNNLCVTMLFMDAS
jgi:hypothetical protein